MRSQEILRKSQEIPRHSHEILRKSQEIPGHPQEILRNPRRPLQGKGDGGREGKGKEGGREGNPLIPVGIEEREGGMKDFLYAQRP